MSGRGWFALMAALLAATLLAYFAMRRLERPLPEHKRPEVSEVYNGAPVVSEIKVSKPSYVHATDSALEEIWMKSLFQDDRSEMENVSGTGATAGEAGSQQQVNSQFELVGLARVGRKEQTAPIAIIIQVKENSGKRAPGRQLRGNAQQQQQQQQPQNTGDRRVDKSVYRIGDVIGSTGYTVKEIIPEEDKVVLTRGGVDTVLILDEKNTNNSIRRSKVQGEALSVREKYKAAAAKEAKEAKEAALEQVKSNVQSSAMRRASGRPGVAVNASNRSSGPPGPPGSQRNVAGQAETNAVPEQGRQDEAGKDTRAPATNQRWNRNSEIPPRPAN